MDPKDKITQKIRELIQLSSEEESEWPTHVILLALQGSRLSLHDDKLAINVQNYVKDVLIPLTEIKLNNKKINLN